MSKAGNCADKDKQGKEQKIEAITKGELTGLRLNLKKYKISERVSKNRFY